MMYEGLLLLIVFVLGTAIGSFLNVLVDRLPVEKGIGGRSMCDYCGKVLDVLELIPILSFVVQRGRSACCDKKLSAYYPFVEILTGVLFVTIFLRTDPLNFLLYSAITSVLVVIFFADMKYHIIPDAMVVALVLLSTPLVVAGGPVFFEHVGAGLALFAGMLVIFVLTKGKGMGFGDVKLAFAIGYLLGLMPGFFAIYIGFILGGIFSIAYIVLKTALQPVRAGNSEGQSLLKTKIAFGPFLIIGVMVMMIWSREILTFVKSLIV